MVTYSRVGGEKQLKFFLRSFLCALNYIYYFKTSHLEVHSEEEVAWTLDGENGGIHKDVEIRNIGKAFQICVPEKK